LRSPVFLHGTKETVPGIRDVEWYDENAEVLTQEAWADPEARLLTLQRAVGEKNMVDVTLLMLNASQEDRTFLYPYPELPWIVKIDSGMPETDPEMAKDGRMLVRAHSAVLLAAALLP
jgi:glycogen operon protein